MKKLFISIAAMAFSLCASAQFDNSVLQNLDQEEDTIEVTTLNDIVSMQQKIFSVNNREKHYNDVWHRCTFFNISTNSMKLDSKEKVATEDGEKMLSYKSDWGVGIQWGTSYRLHKPIEKMVCIGLDWTYVDLSVNHFKAENEATYNSKSKRMEEGQEKYYMPWNLEKYEADYGMSLGPSVTVAPFVPLHIKNLDYIRLHAYYHIGYSASVNYILNDEKRDLNTDDNNQDHRTMKDNLKLNWGHGLYTAFGVDLTWKWIGLGFEHRNSEYEYKSMSTSDFGKVKNKFKAGVSRFFIQFRF